MNTKTKVGAGAGVGVLAAAVIAPLLLLGGGGPLEAGLSCGADQSTSLSAYLSGRPANSTVTLSKGACYTVDSTVQIRGTTGLTIHGNGATFKQPTALFGADQVPIVQLWQDTNLRIDNLIVDGAYDGTNGGVDEEGDYGIQVEAANGVTVSQSTIENTQGDWIYLAPAFPDIPDNFAVNTGVTFSTDTFDHAGYHGLTVESVGCLTIRACNGATFTNSTMNDMAVDAMDFEVDPDPCCDLNPDGTPSGYAEDYVSITNNTWTNWSNDWFASIQGQLPGVQEQHLTISGNRLDWSSPLFEVVGTNTANTPLSHQNAYWTIKNNVMGKGFYATPYRGGLSSAGQLYSITQLDMENNTFPLCTGPFSSPQPLILCNDPGYYFVDLDNINGTKIKNNDLTGAQGPVQPQMYDTEVVGVTQCGNKYGPGGTLVDATC